MKSFHYVVSFPLNHLMIHSFITFDDIPEYNAWNYGIKLANVHY